MPDCNCELGRIDNPTYLQDNQSLCNVLPLEAQQTHTRGESAPPGFGDTLQIQSHVRATPVDGSSRPEKAEGAFGIKPSGSENRPLWLSNRGPGRGF